ncbi:MAG TPA: serine hydrolase domain-containing protein [Acidimicrobiales bacterium]|nr:serine hydrolase domain-containing protein [Acidimicrobiales bacterium]
MRCARMTGVPVVPDLAELAAWNPTLLVRTAGQSSAAGPSSQRAVYAASVAKQFTAFLAALLITERRWTAGDQIRAMVPELPSWADGIEVQHLVHHSSGLPSTPRLRENGVEWPVAWGNAEVLAAIVRDVVPVRPPGAGWEYCSLGYVLLAVAIERLIGHPFEELARERLFEPGGITASQFGGPPPGARVTGTEPATIGEGGLWTTPADLERWNHLMNARAFGPVAHDLAERPGRLQDGSIMANGWGVGIVRSAGRVFFHRGGDVEGWTTKVVRERTSGTSVVLATDGAPPQLVHDTALQIALDASVS